LKTEFEGIFLGNDVRGKCSVDEEGCKDMFFVAGKHMRVTVEVLQDRGTGSTGTVTKCCVTMSRRKKLMGHMETSLVVYTD